MSWSYNYYIFSLLVTFTAVVLKNIKYSKIGLYKFTIWSTFLCSNAKENYGFECYFAIFLETVSTCTSNAFKTFLGASKMKQS